MGTIAKWNVFLVLMLSLVLTVSAGGIRPSPAFGCDGCGFDGWMTGGGSIFRSPDCTDKAERVTYGYVLHCDRRQGPNNLEIVDHATNRTFHLTELTHADCWDEPGIEPSPPDAGFDNFFGVGYGRCTQPKRDCMVIFHLIDGGERGGCVRDATGFTIIDLTTGKPVIRLNLTDVDCGNNQAHDGF
jgi:hypothetical protein